LSAIDNYTNHVKHGRRNSTQPQTRKADGNIDELDDSDGLIGLTRHMNKQVNEEKQKEDENIRHQIRKLVEQQRNEQQNIDHLRQDFLKLAPNKMQKPRIDAAYENQKRKFKEKIASLERKKQNLEGKLSSNRNQSNEQLKGSENGSENSFNQNSRNNSATGTGAGVSAWGEHEAHEGSPFAGLSLIDATSQSCLSKTTKSMSTHSLEVKSNTSSTQGERFDYDAQLRAHRDDLEAQMRDMEEKIHQTGQEIHDCYRKIEQNQTETKQEHESLHEKIVKLVNDFDTQAECRVTEMRSLRNDLDEQLNMVIYGSKSRHDELCDKIEKLEQKLEDMENRQRYRRQLEQQQEYSIMSEKSLKTLIDTLLHLAGMVLLLISSIKKLLNPCVRSTSRAVASVSIVIISIVVYHHTKYAS